MGEDEGEMRHDEGLDQERKRLEEAGWEVVEKNSQKVLWRNPESGRLFPQSAAVKLIETGQVPKFPD